MIGYQKLGSVLASRNQDSNGVVSALLLVEFSQSLAETMHFDTDAGVFAFLEVLWLAEDIDCDRVFGYRLGVFHQRFAANVAQQLREPARLPEGARGEDNRE